MGGGRVRDQVDELDIPLTPVDDDVDGDDNYEGNPA